MDSNLRDSNLIASIGDFWFGIMNKTAMNVCGNKSFRGHMFQFLLGKSIQVEFAWTYGNFIRNDQIAFQVVSLHSN